MMKKTDELRERIKEVDAALASEQYGVAVLEAKRNRLLEGIKNATRRELKEDTNVDVYASHDYAGMSTGNYRFYFGYEYTVCGKHGATDCDCEAKEWAFVAWTDDKEIMRIPESKLDTRYPNTPEMSLLHGVGQFIGSLKARE